MSRSRSSQRRKVEQARAIVDQALGDVSQRDGPRMASKYMPITKPTKPVQPKSEPIGVLTLRESAVRLGLSTDEMEALVKQGSVKTLMAGWTVFVPSNEIEKLRRAH
jgi:hypothetical protein